MPLEKLNYNQISEYLVGGDLKLIAHKHEFGGHTTTWYKVVLPAAITNRYRQCDRFQYCKKAAEFMLKERDHWGQEWVSLFCDDHATDGMRDKWKEAMGGGPA